MINRKGVVVAAIAVAYWFAGSTVAQKHQMPSGMSHEEHLAQLKREAEMKQRGNVAMGFDQDITTHHFYLANNGGVIQVESNDPADTTSRDQIRAHLKEIAQEFAKGKFDGPLATHNETPPGVPAMQRLKSKIVYLYEERPRGASVRITSQDKAAVRAVHEFLRYQIREHVTGDPLTVTK
jgi:hypothetical protein